MLTKGKSFYLNQLPAVRKSDHLMSILTNIGPSYFGQALICNKESSVKVMWLLGLILSLLLWHSPHQGHLVSIVVNLNPNNDLVPKLTEHPKHPLYAAAAFTYVGFFYTFLCSLSSTTSILEQGFQFVHDL